MTDVAASAGRESVTLGCRQCGAQFAGRRSHAKTCSPACRTRRWRAGPPTSHQRQVRELLADVHCRAVVPLAGCTVARITAAQARPLIERHEWLGRMNSVPVAIYGLQSPAGELLGVASFGCPNGTASRDVCGPEWRDRAIALERGACVPWAHPHAASYLISRAVKAVGALGYVVVVAYCDPEAGERGVIYQALGWLYLGQGVGRPGHRWRARVDGGPWLSDRRMRALGHRGKETWQALRADPRWEFKREPAKGKYVTFTGDRRTRRAARAALRYEPKPYPARSPTRHLAQVRQGD